MVIAIVQRTNREDDPVIRGSTTPPRITPVRRLQNAARLNAGHASTSTHQQTTTPQDQPTPNPESEHRQPYHTANR